MYNVQTQLQWDKSDSSFHGISDNGTDCLRKKVMNYDKSYTSHELRQHANIFQKSRLGLYFQNVPRYDHVVT